MKFLLLFTSSILLITSDLFAQQDARFSQYMFNGLYLNPAYAGSQEGIENTIYHRKQWNGFNDSPNSFSYSICSPFSDKKSGVGFLLVHEKFGYTNQTTLLLMYNYKIRLSKGILAMGIEGGTRQLCSNYDKLIIENPTDPLLQNNIKNRWMPEIGAGIYYQTSNWTISLSARRMNSRPGKRPTKFTSLHSRYYNIYYAKKIHLSKSAELIPLMLVTYYTKGFLQANATLIIKYNYGIWLGGGWRTSNELTFLAGVQINQLVKKINEDIKLGYSYDYGFSNLYKYNSGTHELFLSYRFKTKPNPKKILREKIETHPIFF